MFLNKLEFSIKYLFILNNIILFIFRTVCAIWQSLGKDQMCSQIIDTLLEFITLTPLYDTNTKQFLNKPVASLIPIAVSINSSCFKEFKITIYVTLINYIR